MTKKKCLRILIILGLSLGALCFVVSILFCCSVANQVDLSYVASILSKNKNAAWLISSGIFGDVESADYAQIMSGTSRTEMIMMHGGGKELRNYLKNPEIMLAMVKI